MDGQVPAEVVQNRYDRLAALVEETTYAENQKLTGATVEVLVAEGEGRKDAATHRMSGRARDNRLVHFTPHAADPRRPAPRDLAPHDPAPRDAEPHAVGAPRPGDIVTVTVTRGAPHYLLSDAAPLSVRRTRAGDAWETSLTAPAPAAASAGVPVALGMPGRLSPAR
jgi:tRNA-2-methylthio-N6-dimethylallyladenosine synthase